VPLPDLPLGFLVLGTVPATFGLLALTLLAEPDGAAADRGAAGLIAALSLLTAEALWLQRPWVFPACLAYVVSFGAAALIGNAWGDGSLRFALGVLMLTLLVASPALGYVQHRSNRLFGPRRWGSGAP
jgi:hypothetical protein